MLRGVSELKRSGEKLTADTQSKLTVVAYALQRMFREASGSKGFQIVTIDIVLFRGSSQLRSIFLMNDGPLKLEPM